MEQHRAAELVKKSKIRQHAVRASGHGGQNVNKRSTKVQLVRAMAENENFLREGEREKIEAWRAQKKIGAEREKFENIPPVELRVESQATRHQHLNFEDAKKKLVKLLAEILWEEAERVPTRVPRIQRKKRRDAKKHRGK
jgi:Protein chain release factor B